MMPSPAALGPVVDNEPPSPESPSNHQLLFKKHKVLPHPRKDASLVGLRGSRLVPATAATLSRALSEYASNPYHGKPFPKRLGGGPDLPPTPPAHSRNSSATYSAQPSMTTYVQSPEQSAEDVQMKPPPPTTPTKQLSPPTPDVTPPSATESGSQPSQRSQPRGIPARGMMRERELSKGTNDSRTESFKTARENPSSGDEDGDGQSTLRPAPSARTSESTVRRIYMATGAENASRNGPPSNGAAPNSTAKRQRPQAVGLGLGLESSPEQSLTPLSKRDFVSFDGEWGATGNDEVVKEWDYNLDRNVIVRKRRGPTRAVASQQQRGEVLEDVTVSPTNATRAVRSMSLPQRALTFPSPIDSPEQSRSLRLLRQPREPRELAGAAPITAHMGSVMNAPGSDNRRVSTISSKSTSSTAFDGQLQRRKTLRHVRKQVGLRDSISDMSPVSSAPTSVLDDSGKQNRQSAPTIPATASVRFHPQRQDSVLSTRSVASVSSRSARRDIWRAGGIPVIIVPDRRSSVRSTSREPSLRSASSRHSRRSQSAHSNPASQFSGSRGRGRSSRASSGRRSRAYSESDGSAPGDQRTLDYPPVVPKRTSSLSAPTSRNASRSGSLTSESITAHAELLQSKLQAREDEERLALSKVQQESTPIKSSPPVEVQSTKATNKEGAREIPDALPPKAHVEHVPAAGLAIVPVPHFEESEVRTHHFYPLLLDPRMSSAPPTSPNSHLSPQNTPFSMVSVDTATSHAEVSEALAVSIYAHQNTSILMVDHSTRQSECSSESQDHATDSTSSSESRVDVSPWSSSGSGRRSSGRYSLSSRPVIKTPGRTVVTDNGPVTPPYPIFSMDDVDSPLRNPRAPPAPPSLRSPPMPPAINFIPATPSGMTPAPERELQMGNFSEFEEKPKQNVSVLRRVLTRRRQGEYGPSASRTSGITERTRSLRRSVKRSVLGLRRSESVDRRKDLVDDSEPAEGDKLHPFWRPTSFYQGDDSPYMRDEDNVEEEEEEEEEGYFRYPPIDNRPRLPRRSMSERVRRTFAILPMDDDEDSYLVTSGDGPDRRTVRRTPSGNLRVVRHRSSGDSSAGRTTTSEESRPQTAPQEQEQSSSFWRAPSLFLKRRESVMRREGEKHSTLPRIVDKLGEHGLQSIPRRFSERRREKRSNELRQKISGPQAVRDGVGEVIRRSSYRDAYTQSQATDETAA